MPVEVPGSSEGLGLSSWRAKFIQDIGTPLFIGLTICELNGVEAVAFVEPACSGVGLEGVQANRRRQDAQCVF